MICKSLLLVCTLASSGTALADCPLYPDRAPQPVLATGETAGADVQHGTVHRVNVAMSVPVHLELEVRVVVSELPPEERDGLVGAMDKLAQEIERRAAAGIMERFDISPTVNARSNYMVQDAQEAEQQLISQGFRRAKEGEVPYDGRLITGSVWIKGTPTMENRTVNAQVVRSRAVVRVTARVCIDDKEGLIGFAPTASVIDLGSEAQPDAQVPEADRNARHAEFLATTQAEADRLSSWFRQYLHRVSDDERTAMRARTGGTFPVKVSFTFLGKAQELPVEVTSLIDPVINQAL